MLKGFGIANYRSFGPHPQRFAPLSRLNVFAGKNNSGKSNVLRAVAVLDAVQSNREMSFSPHLDLFNGSGVPPEIYLLSDRASQENLLNTAKYGYFGKEQIATNIARILRDFGWFGFRLEERRLGNALNRVVSPTIAQLWEKIPDKSFWYEMCRALTALHSGGSTEEHIADLLLALRPRVEMLPMADLMMAHRQIGPPSAEFKGLSGQGIIEKLAKLERPDGAKLADKERFKKICAFVGSVTGYPGARLEVSRESNELLVTMNGRTLPIESLGTGIHQVILFAVAATLTQNSTVCIEEPETNLHPGLQRQLMTYLATTDNQYFITTHSAHILDTPDTSVFHVQLNEGGATVVNHLNLPTTRAHLCFDLGYRASDLVQANSVIWVEGPSDRIYLRAWISNLAPDLVEGTHYSIMFYGGRLLSHLTANDPEGDEDEIKEFISLLRLNRNVAILIDSDKRRAGDDISDTKKRIKTEVENAKGLVWITEGREIENYLTPAIRDAALKSAHSRTEFKPARTKWQCCYEPKKGTTPPDKIAIARAASKAPDLDCLDLRARVTEFVDFIKRCN